MNLPPGSRDLVRIVFGVLLIVLLIGGALWILSPFLPALMGDDDRRRDLAVAAAAAARAGGRRTLAAVAMTGLLSLIVVAPLAIGVSTIVQQAARLSDIKVAEIRSDAAGLDRGRSGRRRDADRRVARLRGGDAGGAGEQGLAVHRRRSSTGSPSAPATARSCSTWP